MDPVIHKVKVGEIEDEDKADSFKDLICFHKDCGGGAVVWSRGFLVCHNCKDIITKLPLYYHREKKVIRTAANGAEVIAVLDYEERVKFSQKKIW